MTLEDEPKPAITPAPAAILFGSRSEVPLASMVNNLAFTTEPLPRVASTSLILLPLPKVISAIIAPAAKAPRAPPFA